MTHNPRWPRCDWCAEKPGCEEGNCDCCEIRCNCPSCVGPVYEDVFPKEMYPESWKEKERLDRLT